MQGVGATVAGDDMKITGEVFQVGGGGYTSAEDAAVYLVHFGESAALVDAGCGYATERLLKNIRNAGVDPGRIELLLITHCHFDHTGGAAAVKKRLGCRVVAHELDAPYLEAGDNKVTAANWYGATMEPFVVDRKLIGAREEIQLGGKVIQADHIPGHSPGSVAYICESEGLKILFGQDVHGPLDRSLRSNREDYQESLKYLLTLEADILCEGHYGVYRGKGEVARFIRQFLSSR